MAKWMISVLALTLLAACGGARPKQSACSGAPALPDPGTATQGSQDPGSPDPGSIDLGSTDPGSSDLGSPDPGSPDPGSTDLGILDLGLTDPGGTDLALADPGTSDPGTLDPASLDSGSLDGGVTASTDSVETALLPSPRTPSFVKVEANNYDPVPYALNILAVNSRGQWEKVYLPPLPAASEGGSSQMAHSFRLNPGPSYRLVLEDPAGRTLDVQTLPAPAGNTLIPTSYSVVGGLLVAALG